MLWIDATLRKLHRWRKHNRARGLFILLAGLCRPILGLPVHNRTLIDNSDPHNMDNSRLVPLRSEKQRSRKLDDWQMWVNQCTPRLRLQLLESSRWMRFGVHVGWAEVLWWLSERVNVFWCCLEELTFSRGHHVYKWHTSWKHLENVYTYTYIYTCL